MQLRRLVPAVLLVLPIAPIGLPTSSRPAPSLLDRVSERLAGQQSDYIEVRRDLHRHPEVSLEESRTARVVAERLRALGLEVLTGVGGHGVVAFLKGGRPGPTVAYRADMDAVPSDAPDPVDFRSVTPGVRHICGHDVHTTVALALADGLSSVRAELPGTVMFVFQPAEERAVGAQAMIDAGLFRTTRPDAIIGLHTAPFPVGQLVTTPGTMMAWRDGFSVTISGDGDLDRTQDSVTRLVRAIGTVSGAEAVAPMAPGFIFVQAALAKRAEGERTIRGSISVATEAASERARSAITALAELRVPGVTVQTDYRPRQIPGVTNDAALTGLTSGAIRAALGDTAVVDIDVISPAFSEDFGAFERIVPGAFYYLGVGPIGMPHSPGYVADERAILVGARAMAAAILARLGA